MPTIPVKTSSGKRTYGKFQYLSTGAAVGIQVSRYSPQPRMTAAHEIGHFIDHQAIGNAGVYASENHARMQAFREAVRQTDTYKQLELLRDTHHSKLVRDHVRYMLQDREVFARSYAQFIAQRSGDRTMLDELEVIRSPGPIPYQWSDRDFQRVEQAIEDVLRDLKWLK